MKFMRNLSIAAGSLLVLCGCYMFHGPESDEALPPATTSIGPASQAGTQCVTRTLRAGDTFEPVDMVWVVDSSRSMSDERARIEQTMNEFVRAAEARNFNLRLVMVTSTNIVPAPLRDDPERYLFVQRNVRSREPLRALLDEWPRYEDFLRRDAALHFVIVTDDDSDLSAADFVRELDRRLQRGYRVHAVASPDVGGAPCQSEEPTAECRSAGRARPQVCGAAAIGREYYALAEQSGGEEISVCLNDWGKVFGPLLEAVTPTQIPCTVALDSGAELAATQVAIQIERRGHELRQVAGPRACEAQPDGYYYDDSEQGALLTLCPTACAATMRDGAELTIRSHCQ